MLTSDTEHDARMPAGPGSDFVRLFWAEISEGVKYPGVPVQTGTARGGRLLPRQLSFGQSEAQTYVRMKKRDTHTQLAHGSGRL